MHKRLFPAYTDAQLESMVAGVSDVSTRSKMEIEIAARKAGISKPLAIPQVAWN